MKPLNKINKEHKELFYKTKAESKVYIEGFDGGRKELTKDFREMVQRFKQRKWMTLDKSSDNYHCQKCLMMPMIISYHNRLCIDCALEQDFGKELTEERK